MPDIRFAYRPFAEQVRFFERKVSVPTKGWQDLVAGDHSHGFMVAGATKAALLDDFKKAIGAAISEGTTLDQFRVKFDEIVGRHGWTGWTGEGSAAGRAWRTRVIFETNIQQSYNAGRYAQLTHPDSLAGAPYWQYRHDDLGLSRVPRPLHVAWHGMVLHHSDPWWATHFPANGWGCKCSVRALSAAGLKRNQLTVGKAPDSGLDGVDPGFEYSPGAEARSLPAAQSFGERVMAMPAPWREQSLADAQTRAADWFGQFPQMVSNQAREHDLLRAANAAQALDPAAPKYFPMRTGLTEPMGMLRPAAVAELEKAGITVPGSALLTATDEVAYHALRDAHTDLADLLKALLEAAAWMAGPEALVLWDSQDAALIYARRLDAERFAKLVFRTDFRSKSGGARNMRGRPINALRTAIIVRAVNLQDRRYLLLEGTW